MIRPLTLLSRVSPGVLDAAWVQKSRAVGVHGEHSISVPPCKPLGNARVAGAVSDGIKADLRRPEHSVLAYQFQVR
jgi:hypothetical protein